MIAINNLVRLLAKTYCITPKVLECERFIDKFVPRGKRVAGRKYQGFTKMKTKRIVIQT